METLKAIVTSELFWWVLALVIVCWWLKKYSGTGSYGSSDAFDIDSDWDDYND